MQPVEQAVDKGGLAGSHFARERDNPFPRLNAVRQAGQSLFNLLRKKEIPRIRANVKRVFSQPKEILVHDVGIFTIRYLCLCPSTYCLITSRSSKFSQRKQKNVDSRSALSKHKWPCVPLEAQRDLMHEIVGTATGPAARGKIRILILGLISNREICLAPKGSVHTSACIPGIVSG